MLLVIDIGNTNTVLGVFDGKKLINHYRLESLIGRTTDEYAMMIKQLLDFDNIPMKSLNAVIIACVVPPLIDTFSRWSLKYFNTQPLIVGPGIRTGMPILYESPREVGADRIVDAVAAFEKFHTGMIVVDFGTATTFDVVSPKGEYLGGAICPGIGISLEALFQRTAKLPPTCGQMG